MSSIINSLLLGLTVTVANPTANHRENVPVVVSLPASGEEVKSVTFTGQPDMPYQLDDMNADGRADELVFLVDLKPSATRTFSIKTSPRPSTKEFEAGTSAYIKLNDKNKKHPRVQAITFPGTCDNREMYGAIYGHGVVLEGEMNAIRLYMDNRQSVDLYAKNHPQLELETTGFYTTRDQMNQGYGRDILWAGTSVALGSFRGWQDGKPVTIDSVTTRGQRVITTGPLRSVVEISDRGWVYNGRPVDMTQTYTIYKGHRDYEVDVKVTPSAGLTFCTGVQKVMNDNEGFIQPDGLAGSWGNNVPDKNMAEVVDTLGLGIYVGPKYLVKTLEDDVNYLTILRPDASGRIKYHFTAAALRDVTSPRNPQEWWEYLRKWKTDLANPVRITVKRTR
ncbi:MAG: DUF4861 domain-containing protein [Duncaniella sp.]|nr:DUF4861 domain-containing protein [Duncaniella sp.]